MPTNHHFADINEMVQTPTKHPNPSRLMIQAALVCVFFINLFKGKKMMNIAETVQAKTDEVLAIEREVFERWQGEWYGEYRLDRVGDGYADYTVNVQWQAWRARAVKAITGAAT